MGRLPGRLPLRSPVLRLALAVAAVPMAVLGLHDEVSGSKTAPGTSISWSYAGSTEGGTVLFLRTSAQISNCQYAQATKTSEDASSVQVSVAIMPATCESGVNLVYHSGDVVSVRLLQPIDDRPVSGPGAVCEPLAPDGSPLPYNGGIPLQADRTGVQTC